MTARNAPATLARLPLMMGEVRPGEVMLLQVDAEDVAGAPGVGGGVLDHPDEQQGAAVVRGHREPVGLGQAAVDQCVRAALTAASYSA
jgi:hypothetical protein